MTVAPRPAHAQTLDIGAALSTYRIADGGASGVYGGPVVTIHFSDRHALQLTADASTYRSPYSSTLDVLYAVRYRHTLAHPTPRVALFVAAGTLGGFSRHHTKTTTYTNAGHFEHGVFVPGDPTSFTIPAQTHYDFAPPWVPLVGVGTEIELDHHMAFTAELSGLVGWYYMFGVRASAGLVVRLGR